MEVKDEQETEDSGEEEGEEEGTESDLVRHCHYSVICNIRVLDLISYHLI